MACLAASLAAAACDRDRDATMHGQNRRAGEGRLGLVASACVRHLMTSPTPRARPPPIRSFFTWHWQRPAARGRRRYQATQAVADVCSPAYVLLQSLAGKCRQLNYACGLLQDGQFSHAVVAVVWWAPAGGPACIPKIYMAEYSSILSSRPLYRGPSNEA